MINSKEQKLTYALAASLFANAAFAGIISFGIGSGSGRETTNAARPVLVTSHGNVITDPRNVRLPSSGEWRELHARRASPSAGWETWDTSSFEASFVPKVRGLARELGLAPNDAFELATSVTEMFMATLASDVETFRRLYERLSFKLPDFASSSNAPDRVFIRTAPVHAPYTQVNRTRMAYIFRQGQPVPLAPHGDFTSTSYTVQSARGPQDIYNPVEAGADAVVVHLPMIVLDRNGRNSVGELAFSFVRGSEGQWIPYSTSLRLPRYNPPPAHLPMILQR